MINLFKTTFKGYSQVMLQENALTGLLFFIGILYNSWTMALGSLVGVASAMLVALAFGWNQKDVLKGYYGFNGVLVGIALVFFFGLNFPIVFLIVIGAALSSFIMKIMHERNLYPYTFPFVLSTWILLFFIKVTGIIPLKISSLASAVNINIVSGLSMGFGQVMFQGAIVTGIIFFIAILFNSRTAALYALIGTGLGFAVALASSLPLNLTNIGIFGFNGVLCGIAFAEKNLKSFIFGLAAIILSVFIAYAMVFYDITTLTAPFVFATWVVLLFRRSVKQ